MQAYKQHEMFHTHAKRRIQLRWSQIIAFPEKTSGVKNKTDVKEEIALDIIFESLSECRKKITRFSTITVEAIQISWKDKFADKVYRLLVNCGTLFKVTFKACF